MMKTTDIASELQLATDIAFLEALHGEGLISGDSHEKILNQILVFSTAPIGTLKWRVRLDKNRV